MIETNRLCLRPLQPSDVETVCRIYSDPDVMRFINHGVCSCERAQSELMRYIKDFRERGFGEMAVIEKDSGHHIGVCGFVGVATIGYIFDKSCWGKGYATEAARACLKYGFEKLGYEQIGAGALKANTLSIRVLQKLGMKQTPNEFFDRHGGVFFTITRDAFRLQAEIKK